jgi:hypothetical protein
LRGTKSNAVRASGDIIAASDREERAAPAEARETDVELERL